MENKKVIMVMIIIEVLLVILFLVLPFENKENEIITVTSSEDSIIESEQLSEEKENGTELQGVENEEEMPVISLDEESTEKNIANNESSKNNQSTQENQNSQGNTSVKEEDVDKPEDIEQPGDKPETIPEKNSDELPPISI